MKTQTFNIITRNKITSWGRLREKNFVQMWKVIEKPLRVHRWQLRCIDFNSEVYLGQQKGYALDSGEILGEMISSDLQDVLVNLTNLKVNFQRYGLHFCFGKSK